MTSTIERDDVVQLARDLISIESHRDAPGREAEIGRFLVAWLNRRGIAAELHPVIDERANVVARIPGGDGPSAMLNGHLDTVPAGGMVDAFVPHIEDGVLWGRGACDMKGAIAAMCCAMAAVAGDSARLAGDLFFVGTVDEETGSLGAKALVDSGFRTDYAIVGEPTSLRLGVAHKGSCFVRVTLTGRGAHGSVPERGVSATSYAARILTAVEDEFRPTLAQRTHPLLGTSTVNVGRICGGTQPNIVADRCEIEIDRRYLMGEAEPVSELRQLVASICDGVEGLTYEVAEMPETSIVAHVPLCTPTDSAATAAALAAVISVGVPQEPPIGVAYWTDGGHFAASGVETIILGPGDIAHAHGPHDRVALQELECAAGLYVQLARNLVSGRN